MVPAQKPQYDQAQLRHDRMVLIAMLVLFAGIMALVMWLASMGAIPEDSGFPVMPTFM